MKVKVAFRFDIDEEEFNVPVDGRIEYPIQDLLLDFLHDVSGVTNVEIERITHT